MERIYFAGGLFNQAEKDFNLKLTNVLEKSGYKVFLPQRDGFEAACLNNLSEQEIVKKIFEKDVEEIKKCEVFFMVLDGRVPDDGACVELGIAYSLGKKIYGIKTDVRGLEMGVELNPLIAGCFKRIFKVVNCSAQEELTNFLTNNRF